MAFVGVWRVSSSPRRNVHTMARLNLGRDGGLLVGTVRMEIKAANLAVAAVSALVLAGYVFLENFAPRF
jgi:hypothetical protein